jgi:serine/threonine-protein kinase
LDKGEWDGRFYVETEFVDGVHAATAAAQWRERGGVKGQQMLLRLAKTIARTYAALHERGILHGDVHPDNVLIRRDGTVVVLDFSVARPAVSQTSLPTPPDRSGRAFFFEPEMARVALAGLPSMPASQPGEQHAVATLLYFLMTGAHWQNFRLGRDAMLEDIATLHPLSFRERGVESWPELEVVLGRALSKLPEARFPSIAAFAGALDAVTAPLMTNDLSRSLPFSKFLDQALADPAFGATRLPVSKDYHYGRASL